MFCVYCGAKMHDNGKFCPQCGKPVKSAQPAPVEEVVPVEEADPVKEVTPVEDIAPVEETGPVVEAVPVEEVTAVEENAPVEKVTPVEEVTSVAETAPIEEVTPVVETPPQVNTAKPAKKKSLARKNLTAALAYIISAAVVAGLGLYVIPKLVFNPALEKTAESSTPEAALTLYKAAGNDDAVYNTKFALAQKALESENYAYAAAFFSELKNAEYTADKDLTAYVDEAFGGRCRILINGGKHNLAVADSTQISDELLSASIINDAIISDAKVLSAEGKTVEAYEMAAKINTSAAYDSESYNIIVYNYAVEFYNEMKFAETYEILANATDEASIELRRSSAYYIANDFLKDKDYEKAIEMYEKAEGFSDSAEKIKQCSYQLGLRCYNQGQFEAALEYFEAADGYGTSDFYVQKINGKRTII